MSAVLNMPTKPLMVTPEAGLALPECLTERPHWVAWTYECRDGKWTKCPRTPAGALAKTDTPSTWSTFAEVMAAADQRPDMGVGFVFSTDDPFVGLDLDNCLMRDGTLKAWAVPIMERFSDTYAEVSPSGQGIKIWVRGTLGGTDRGDRDATPVRRRRHRGLPARQVLHGDWQEVRHEPAERIGAPGRRGLALAPHRRASGHQCRDEDYFCGGFRGPVARAGTCAGVHQR